MRPSVEQSEAQIVENAIRVARRLLRDRGLRYHEADTIEEAERILHKDVQAMVDEGDPEGAAAGVMQLRTLIAVREGVGDFARGYSEMLARLGSEYFYHYGESGKALDCLQLAAGLYPTNWEALWETISVCVQGEPFQPEVALPYAVYSAYINPGQNEVDYILRLMAKRNEV